MPSKGWYTDAQITASGYQKRLYPIDTDFTINNSWLSGCMETDGFTFYAVWEADALPSPDPGTALGGSVASFGDASGTVTLELWSEGGDTADYTVTVVDGVYSIESVVAGTYTLKVSKQNHVTREYPVTVGSDALTLDVKLHLIGDIDGNGKVNVGDVSKLNSHLKSTSVITDEYMLLCANVNGGKLNMGDTAALYGHIKGTKPLY